MLTKFFDLRHNNFKTYYDVYELEWINVSREAGIKTLKHFAVRRPEQVEI